MFQEEFQAVTQAARTKADFLKGNPGGYFVSAMLAGAFVGFGIMLIYTIGGLLSGLPHARIVMGASFGIALSLVTMAGAELFTGNNFVMTCGALRRTVGWTETLRLWSVCLAGNWVGAIAFALLFWGTGLASGATGEFLATTAAAKMSIPPVALFLRGMLCNTLVCLAVWCGFRCKSESGKLIMIFWCLFAFITTGYEHSIANMSLLTVALLEPFDAAVSLGGYFYNILVATLGNMAGGILCMALPYHLVAAQRS